MNSSQASAPPTGARLVAIQATTTTAADLIARVWAAGDAVLPLDPSLSGSTAEAIAVDLRAHRLVTGSGHVDLDGGVGVAPGTAAVVLTSGTTGPSRGVVLSHAALDAGVAASVDRLAAHDARWLGVLPLHHVAGLLVVLRARAAGTAPVLHDRFDVARVSAASDVTHVALVPTMLHRLLDHGVDVGRFQCILLGGARPPAGLLERAAAAGARVTTSYGMTETAGGCAYDGRPLDGVAIAVEPDGRVLVRGAVLADGYRVDGALEPLCDDDGWFHTSDLGRFDGDRLVVAGRRDDVIVSGGVNVSTTAVARLLGEHAGVADAAVIGVDDPEWGQRLVAFVVAHDPALPPTSDVLRAHVRAAADPASVPRQVLFVRSLPRTALGKIDRTALRRQIGTPGPG